MPGEWVLWFDARCGTSSRTLELLRRHGVEPALRRFLEEPPTLEEIAALLAKLRLPPQAVARQDEDEYHALRLSARTPAEELVRAFARHPRLLDRPIFATRESAVVARPPERAIELLARPGA